MADRLTETGPPPGLAQSSSGSGPARPQHAHRPWAPVHMLGAGRLEGRGKLSRRSAAGSDSDVRPAATATVPGMVK